MKPRQTDLFETGWLKYLFRPLLIGVMFGCVSLSLVGLVRLIFPEWNGTFLVLGCVLAALEANYSHHLIKARSLRGMDLLRFRVIEVALFFPLLKIGSYIGDSWPSVVADIRAWPSSPELLFDGETIAAFILAFLSWRVATQTVQDFERLGESAEFHRYYVSPLESLAGRFFWGGVVLLIAAGLTRIGIAQLLDLRRPPVPGLILNVLVYFLLGLITLGQVRFITLQKRWQAQEIKVSKEIPGRWARYSLIFIGLVAVLAFLLPTDYTLGLLDLIAWIVGIIASIISFVGMVLFWLFTLPLAWLLSLLGVDTTPLPPSQPIRPQPQTNPAGQAAPGWLQVLQSLVFWVVALGMLFYIVRSYLRDHPELAADLGKLRLIRAIHRLWSALWGWLTGWGRVVMDRVPRGWVQRWIRRAEPADGAFRLLRLRGLSARRQVLYYFLSVVHRAGQQGLARRPAQTPEEFGAVLEHSLPEVQDDMDRLTKAFLEARYSRHAIERDQASRVRAHWQQVKQALRSIRRKAGEDG